MRWTKKLSTDERLGLADTVLLHRKKQLMYPTGWYSSTRRLASLPELETKLKNIIGNLLSQKRKSPVRVLDSGAGLLGISGDLKQIFGNKIHLTALTLRHPNTSLKSMKIGLKETIDKSHVGDICGMHLDGLKDTISNREKVRAFTQHHVGLFKTGKQNAKLVDKIKVGLLENMQGKETYDLIFDISGGMLHTYYPTRVKEVAHKMLTPSGILITDERKYSLDTTMFEVIGQFKIEMRRGWVLRKK